ncbi:carboxymuconolactone decarboxylase family protein [Sphingomonas sp. BIUV-7]|uniref:Carboxymuconolactone decarboxylase family protein n=1 Tax=Sphingomonas natans TaxID=3063330 RepID=A0ABT8YDZ5_9SPHN|nr:carboxymuconolactone decarboxylase family protein [Sphingomonas sp. BIUV-7]MDO6416572.1 carboxymuconolactone decarboxylase family protein [Sphingomonas sp. BIUV-7]
MTTQRISQAQAYKAAPDQMKAMVALEESFATSGLDPELVELLKLRISQTNGCAFCLHMHASDLRKLGVADMKLHLLAGWHESRYFTDRERAALGWAEALTLVSRTHAPDADYAALAAHFSEEEQVRLSFVIGAINLWNRLAIGFRFAHPAAHA